MRNFWILGLVCLLPGCAAFSTDCSRERAELRATESAIAYATRQQGSGFTARLSSRGHANYHCVSGYSGQVRCTKATARASGANLSELYHRRDAYVARMAEHCR